MGASFSAILQPQCCQIGADDETREHEPLLADRERQAVAALVRLFESDMRVSFYEGEPLQALTTLAHSDIHHLQLSAATAFSEISEYDVRPVSHETLEPIMYLLQSSFTDVQHGASAALGNLTRNVENKILVVKMGGLEALVRQMLSPSIDAQINSVGCITNIATAKEAKNDIARSGALIPLTRLARSRDLRVQRNATGALLNMTHAFEHRQQLISAGSVPVLVELLGSYDEEVLYYAATALSNIAVDASGRALLWDTEPALIHALLRLVRVATTKVQSQAILTLRNLASDSQYQIAVVVQGGLAVVLPLLQSAYTVLATSAAACLRNLSIHPSNEGPIVCAGFLPDLVDLVPQADEPELQCHVISTLRNLAANSDSDKQPLIDSGLFGRIKTALMDQRTHERAICELAGALSVFALNGQLYKHLVHEGVCQLLLPLVHSEQHETQYNASLTLGSLAGKGSSEVSKEFVCMWHEPFGGARAYFVAVLGGSECVGSNVRSVAMWTVLALLSSGSEELKSLVSGDREIVSAVEEIAKMRVSTASTCSVVSTSSVAALPGGAKGKGAEGRGYAAPVLDSEQSTVDGESLSGGELGRTSALARQVLALIQDLSCWQQR
ncbi:ARM repeat-containing protein [Martensiomyces pterosporus]|nr:ARM repeat-containing protein [Martensiomyces pterosporus]